MPQIINTNMASLTAQRNLNASQSANNTALERLSSGLRINSSKDDAAGLAISTKFDTQIRGINVAIRNAGDGISLAQIAEGALGSMTDSLQRIRELAVQSANSTNSDGDRQALQAEAKQVIAEITRIGEDTNFNGRKLLDGSFSGAFQVGAFAGDRIDFAVANSTAGALGVGAAAGVSAVGTDTELGNGDLIINGTSVEATNASSDTLSFLNNGASSIAKAAAINAVSDESGVTAQVAENVVGGTSMTAAVTTGTVTLNGVSVSIDTTSDATSSRSAVVSGINTISDQTGIVATDSEDDALGVTLTAADGRNITLDYGGTLTAASTGLAATVAGSKAIVSATSDSVSPSSALDFSATQAASISTGVSLNGSYAAQTNMMLNFTNAATLDAGGFGAIPAQGPVSFNLETTAGNFDVFLDQDYTGADAISKVVTDMVVDINAQINGSGFSASLDSGGALQFVEDTAGAGYITLTNGAEGAVVAFGNADTISVFGETINQDGTELPALAMTAIGRNDAITFDVTSTDRAGALTVNKVTLDDSVVDLDSLVSSINESLALDSNSTVAAFNDGGKLQFKTSSNFEGGISVGNYNDGGNQSESVILDGTTISDDDINALFGFDITTATTATSAGIGVQGTVDLDGTNTALEITNGITGSQAEVTLAFTGGVDASANVLRVTLGDVSQDFAFTAPQSLNADTFVTQFNASLAGNDLFGLVEAETDGTNVSFRSTANTNDVLTLSVDVPTATGAGAGTDNFNNMFLLAGFNDLTAVTNVATQAINDVAATVRSNGGGLNTAGSAVTAQNNELSITLSGGTTSSIEIAAASYSDNDTLVTAINAAITENTTLNGVVQAFNESTGISIRQLDVASTEVLTLADFNGGSGSTDIFGGTGITSAGAGTTNNLNGLDSASSTVTGDAEGELGGADTFEGGYTLIGNPGVNEINITGGNNTGNGNIANAGLAVGSFQAGVATTSTVAKEATVATTRGAGIQGTAQGANTLVDLAGVVPASAPVWSSAADITFGGGALGVTDFSGSAGADASSFDLTLSGAASGNGTVQINLTTAISGMADLLADINDELEGSGIAITAQEDPLNAGRLQFIGSEEGAGLIAVSNINTAFQGTRVTAGTDPILALAGAGQVIATPNATAAAAGGIGVDAVVQNDTLALSVDGGTQESITLTAGAYTDTDAMVTEINTQLAASTNLQGATAFNEDESIVIRTNNTTNSGSLSIIGGNAATNLGLDAFLGTEVGIEKGVKDLVAGDLVINSVSIAGAKDSYDSASYDAALTSSKSASGISVAAAINRSSDDTGVTATANATVVVGGTGSTASTYVAGETGVIHINGVEMGTVTLTGDADTDRTFTTALLNEKSGQTGVVAEDNGVSITLTAADGRNISVAIDNNALANATGTGIGFGAAIGLDATISGIGEADITGITATTAINTYETTHSTVKLESAGTINIQGGINGNTAVADLGFEAGQFGGATDGQYISDIDISTFEGANAAMAAIDNALDKIGEERSNLGALQNRFESTSANLQVASENLTAANSRIRDADFATETAELSRTQVLQQAGISILAQANQRPQQVLSLLG